MRTGARIFSFLVILLVCGLVVYAGLLPWRESRLVERIARGEHPLEAKRYFPFAERTGRWLAQRWVADSKGSGDDAEFQIRESIRNRPLNAWAWLVLAEVKLKQGEREEAAKYVETATQLWPNRRYMLWDAAMLWIRLGEKGKALDTLRSYLRAQPRHLQRVAVMAARLEPDPEKLLAAVLPDAPPTDRKEDYYLQEFLTYAIRQENIPLAGAAWAKLPDETLREPAIAQRYIDFLVKQKQLDKAISAWARIGGADPLESIINGGFEEIPAQGGFGWITKDVKGVKWKWDDEVAYKGNASLQINFTGKENVNYHHLSQLVPVEAGAKYRLRGYWRGAYVTTRSNPYFEILSVGAEKESRARTESKRLTWDWQPFETGFAVPADAWFVRIRLRRNQTDSLDNQISGTLWLDDLVLEKLPGKQQ